MNSPTHPFIQYQTNWQNGQSQHYSQILPKSLPVLTTSTHGLEDNVANLMIKLNRNINSQPYTRGIKHFGLSGYLIILACIMCEVTRQESSPKFPHLIQSTVTCNFK